MCRPTLLQVPVDITNHFSHVFVVMVVKFAPLLSFDLDDPTPGFVLITTEAMIADKPEPKGQAGGGMPGGMGGMDDY